MKVLFLTHRVPYAPNRGDRIRAYHLLQDPRSREVRVCVVALAHDREEASQGAALAPLCDEWHVARLPRLRNLARAVPALTSSRPLTHVLLDSPALAPLLADICLRWQPDIVLAYCSGMARFALEPPLSALPFVLDMVDVDSEKWALLARQGGLLGTVYRREARRLAGFEATAATTARRALVVNERERAALAQIAPQARITIVPNGVDLNALRPPPHTASEEAVVFTGVFSYQPNAAGAAWLAREVWPLVRRERPGARLFLVGSDPPRSLRQCSESDPSVTVTGTVDDVRPFLWRSRVAAAPVFVARGLQNKVLEALAAGLNVVTTSAVLTGLPPELARVCSSADAPEPFARALAAHLASDARHDFEDVLRPLAWDRALAALPQILRESARAKGSTHSDSFPSLVSSDA